MVETQEISDDLLLIVVDLHVAGNGYKVILKNYYIFISPQLDILSIKGDDSLWLLSVEVGTKPR